MPLGMLLGGMLGILFVLNLRAFVFSIRYRREARQTGKRYFDVLREHNSKVTYVDIVTLLKLEWLMESKFVITMGYVLNVLIMVVCLALVVALLILYFNGYQEFFNSRW